MDGNLYGLTYEWLPIRMDSHSWLKTFIRLHIISFGTTHSVAPVSDCG